MGLNSFGTFGRIAVDGTDYTIERLDALPGELGVERLPYSPEGPAREPAPPRGRPRGQRRRHRRPRPVRQGGRPSSARSPSPRRASCSRTSPACPASSTSPRCATPSPRSAATPEPSIPLIPVDLVIDHSVIVDVAGTPDALRDNADSSSSATASATASCAGRSRRSQDLRVVPPGHRDLPPGEPRAARQVVFRDDDGPAYPDTLVGTDSHTPMVNGLGVVGWGVGGIEAEAAMLGQPISMLVPPVVGIRLTARCPRARPRPTSCSRSPSCCARTASSASSSSATAKASPACRSRTGRRSATCRRSTARRCTIFPIDDETLRYLRLTGRPEERVALVEAYAKEQGLWHDPDAVPVYDETLELDLSTVVPSLAGPSRPQDRVPLDRPSRVPQALAGVALGDRRRDRGEGRRPVTLADGRASSSTDGAVVIAAITSCTNTSNPRS